jgi:ubiquinone/menaquinone biosynthesis C-methylase UbiE
MLREIEEMKALKSNIEKSLKGHIDYNEWMLDEKRKYLKYIPKDIKTVLDVGCGVGELVWLLKKAGYEVEGCDLDPICIEKTLKIESNIKCADAQKLSNYFQPNKFDLVTCMHILEHLPSPHDALLEIKFVSKKYALIAVPNARNITFNERETHLFSWNSSTLKNLAEKAGFKVVKMSVDWSNVVPSIIKFTPLLNKVLLRAFYDPLELIALLKKQ